MARTAEFMLIRLQIVMHMGLGVRTHASHKTSCDVKVTGQHKNARGPKRDGSSRFSLLFEHDLFGKPLRTFPDHALAASRLADVRADFHSRLDAAAK
jgi:hypothetical protein